MFWKNSIDKLKKALDKTRKVLTSGISELFKIGRKIDDKFLEELEEKFISADVGVETTMSIIENLKLSYKNKEIKNKEEILLFLKNTLIEKLSKDNNDLIISEVPPTVILVAGVNGCGKTTSIGKLAYYLSKNNKKVLLAASDTFRAAAIEQLEKWAKKVNVGIIKQHMGSDPASVAYDALESAIAKKVDVLIIDTAGRLHTQKNLMQELNKIYRVIQKKLPEAPHEVMLVLDSTTGQNAILQAKNFKEIINVSGLFLSKLDGTAKGGSVLAIQNQINIPVKFIGIGEQFDDIEPFDSKRFVDALLN